MTARKLTDALLRRAADAARKHSDLSSQITEAMQERYGCTHSDVDCDTLIDTLDYGTQADNPTVADCDREMGLCGVSPRPASPRRFHDPRD